MKLYRTRKIHAILAIFLAMTLIIPQMALADTSSTVTDQLGTVSQTVYGDQSSTVSGTVYGDLPGDTSEAANDEQTGSVSQAADEGQSVVDKVYNAVGNTPLTVSITKAVLPDGNVISDGQSVTAGSKITVYASVYGENIIQISFECKFGNSVQEVVYSVENGYYKTLHQPTLPGAHEMMVSARDSEGNEVTDSLSMMVKTPQVIFTAGDSEANADTDKVYYNRKSGNNDVLSFELSGLAPGVPYAVEFGYIEDETFTVSGAVYDGILSGVETGSGTYAFSTPIMNRHNNGMHPLAARLYDGMHEQPSVPFPISEVDQDGSTTDSYVNINLPLPEGYASIDLSAEDEDDLRNVNESTLTLTPVASGEATLTVIANDGNGRNASTTFNVTVDEDSNDSDTPPTADEGSNDSNSSQTGSSNESSDNNQGAGEINLTDNTAAEVQVDDAGRTVATVRLDEQSVLQAIESGADLSIAVIEVGGSVDEAKAEIPAGVISRLADNGTLIEQRTELGNYRIPAKALQQQVDMIAAQLGVDPARVQVTVTIKKAGDNQVKEINNTVAAMVGGRLLARPVDFSVQVTAGNQTVEVPSFGRIYIERSIAVSEIGDANRVTGAVLRNGELNQWPAGIFPKE